MWRSKASSSAPAERLWSLASDVERWGERLPTVTSVTPLQAGPAGVGTRYEVRQPGLPKAVYEITDWQPHSFTWVTRSPGLAGTGAHTVRAEGSGSRIELTYDWSGPLAWLARRLLRTRGQRYVETEARTFARLAEQE